ncbi:MAG: acyl-CoA dehydrogenase family protein [Hyphomonas sp.]
MRRPARAAFPSSSFRNSCSVRTAGPVSATASNVSALKRRWASMPRPPASWNMTAPRGWLIGEANKGLACMFTMMNSARLNVGLEGVAVGEAACQTAFQYAQDRKQGKVEGVDGPAPILHHADVRRTLTTMRARVAAAAPSATPPASRRTLRSQRPTNRPATLQSCAKTCSRRLPALVHRYGRRHCQPRRADPWRHGLHERDARRPALPGRPHRADL